MGEAAGNVWLGVRGSLQGRSFRSLPATCRRSGILRVVSPGWRPSGVGASMQESM